MVYVLLRVIKSTLFALNGRRGRDAPTRRCGMNPEPIDWTTHTRFRYRRVPRWDFGGDVPPSAKPCALRCSRLAVQSEESPQIQRDSLRLKEAENIVAAPEIHSPAADAARLVPINARFSAI